MSGITVLIVDDQNLFAESLKTSIHNYTDDINVVGIAAHGREAIELWQSLRPSVILMDVRMPVMDGVEAAKILKERDPSVRIIMLSTHDEDGYVREALAHGADGYLLKDISPTELIASIRALDSGISQISPKIVDKLIRNLHEDEEPVFARLSEKLDWLEKLTKREKEIFTLIATGCDNDQIACELSLSEGTVRNHVSMIYAKLGVENRLQIIRLANQIRYH